MKKEIEVHPIQLEYIGVKELVAKTFIPPEPGIELGIEKGLKPKFSISHSEYDKESKTFSVYVRVTIGEDKEDTKCPVFLHIGIIGFFKVVSDEFDLNNINHFAEHNAFYVMQPYLRDYLFSLSAKCGFKPVLLPLVKVPIFMRKDFVKKKKLVKRKKTS